MIPELKNLVLSYCQTLEDVLIFLGYHQDLDHIKIKLPKYYILPPIIKCAENGHLLSVHYLHFIGKTTYTTWAMDYASENGHLEVVKFLHSVGKDCTTNAIYGASANGHLEVVQFLYAIGKQCPDYVMEASSKNGHTKVVEFLKSIK